jgi:protein kinase C substrate 80K-H
LHSILEELSKGYNPNYQDMAVKAAVVGYEEYMKPLSDANSAEGEGEGGVKVEEGVTTSETDTGVSPVPSTELEEEISDSALDDLEKKDLEALLLSDLGDDESESNDEEGVCKCSAATASQGKSQLS